MRSDSITSVVNMPAKQTLVGKKRESNLRQTLARQTKNAQQNKNPA
jgi:hypothetical protein